MRKLADMTDPSFIKDLEARTKREALDELLELIGRSPNVRDLEAFRRAVFEREKLTSTGLGLSVAVPHAKVPEVSDYVLAVGRARGGIEFDSIDGQPAKLLFLVGASDRQSADFVRCLAAIVNMIKNGRTRVALLDAEGPEEIHRILRKAEK